MKVLYDSEIDELRIDLATPPLNDLKGVEIIKDVSSGIISSLIIHDFWADYGGKKNAIYLPGGVTITCGFPQNNSHPQETWLSVQAK